MKNFVHGGTMVPITSPSGGLLSGQGVVLGFLFGVAAEDAAEGSTVEIATTGVYDLPKASGDTVTAGARLYWNNTNKNVTTTASGNSLIGVATEAAGSSAATVRARLNGVSV